eukprot:SAG25_NODE_764_length_5503_cov_13.115470_5_plen_81_part_00
MTHMPHIPCALHISLALWRSLCDTLVLMCHRAQIQMRPKASRPKVSQVQTPSARPRRGLYSHPHQGCTKLSNRSRGRFRG